MTRYRITGTRYDANGKPITAQHSTVIDTKFGDYRRAVTEDEISKVFLKEFNVAQPDGSGIKVDKLERLAEETDVNKISRV